VSGQTARSLYKGIRLRALTTLSPEAPSSGLNVTVRLSSRGEAVEVSKIASNTAFVEVDQVHLVPAQTSVGSQQRADERVGAGLRDHALAGMRFLLPPPTQDNARIGRRRSGAHGVGVLLVAQGISDDERPDARSRSICRPRR